MKRSEALKIIQKGLLYYVPPIEDYILSELEEAGMLPPEIVRYTDLPNGTTICNPECSWDSEDE